MKKTFKLDSKNNIVGKKVHIGSYAFDLGLTIFMIIFSVIMIYPIINVVAVSLSSPEMISSGTVMWLPKEFNPEGYKIVFGQITIWRAYKNTIIYALSSAFISLLFTSMIAYSMMVPKFVLKKQLTIFLLITMFFSGGTVPTYLLIRELNMINTMWALVLPNAINAFNVFIYKSFFSGISLELREAAKMDGASEFRILFSIYMPMSKALYATFGLFAIVYMWNSYFEALLYIKDEAKQPIQMVLRTILFTSGVAGGSFSDVNQMIQSGKINPKNVQYATIFATIAPVLMIYPFIQKHFTQGMYIGGIKG